MPKRAWVSRLRSEGFDYHTYKWRIKPLFGASAYRTSLKEVLGSNLCTELPYHICLPDQPYLGWIGSWQFPVELREEIVETQKYNISKDDILLTHGTSLANSVVIMLSLNPGDEVVGFNPTWFQFNVIPRAIGAKTKVLKRREEDGWKFDTEELKEAITPKTKLIMVNSPNNPTGAVLDKQEMRAICEIAEDSGVRLLCDEIYRGLEWGPDFSGEWDYAFSSPSAVNFSETAVSAASVSKTLSLVGCKIGWIATRDKDFLDKSYRFMGYLMLHLNLLGKLVATAALEPSKYKEILGKKRRIGSENWKTVSDWIEKRSDIFNWVPPAAGFLSFPKYNLNIKAKEFSDRLLMEPYRTYVQPGYPDYGIEYHLRLGVGRIKVDGVKVALEQVDRFIETLEKRVT